MWECEVSMEKAAGERERVRKAAGEAKDRKKKNIDADPRESTSTTRMAAATGCSQRRSSLLSFAGSFSLSLASGATAAAVPQGQSRKQEEERATRRVEGKIARDAGERETRPPLTYASHDERVSES